MLFYICSRELKYGGKNISTVAFRPRDAWGHQPLVAAALAPSCLPPDLCQDNGHLGSIGPRLRHNFIALLNDYNLSSRLTQYKSNTKMFNKPIDILQNNEREKIPRMGNTRPSRTCVIKENRYYTMILSQYYGCCQYHRSMSIP